ncbi:MAG: YcxB family protein, partial [Bacteroidetes bacterium]|nr:YcxB family protein [Bacteroidota bacterium]
MEFEYQQTKKDYTDFYKQYYANGLKRRAIVIAALLLLAASYFAKDPFEWPWFLIGTISSALLIFSFYYFIPLLRSFNTLNKVLANEPVAFEERKLTVTDEGLLIESENLTKTWTWDDMTSVHDLSNFIYIILTDKRMLLFPKRHFQSDKDGTDFLWIVRGKIKPHFSKSIYGKSSGLSYALGLLGLIPVVGFITGIIFVVRGLAAPKDKWLVLIGSGGIAWTIAFFVLVFNTDLFGFQTSQVKFSQRQINGVMAAVEFYKMKNGVYPDSLQQLEENSQVWIWDPLRPGGKVNKTNEYN